MNRVQLVLTLLRVNPIAAIRLFLKAVSQLARSVGIRAVDLYLKLRHFVADNIFKLIGLALEKSELLNYLYHKYRLDPRASPRWFIPNGQDPISFFSILNEQEVSYCVLRWGESITSETNTDEDIDVLIADNDLEKVQALLARATYKGQPIDLYSVSGVSGSDYEGRPYFPEKLASMLLRNWTLSKRGAVRTPSGEAELLSLVYHLVFHKQWSSSKVCTSEQQRILHRLASLGGFSNADREDAGQVVVQKALQHLLSLGLIPPREDCRMLARKVPSSPLVQLLSEKDDIRATELADNYLFFVCRESLFRFSCEKSLVEALSMDGLTIQKRIRLSESQKKILAKASRGGNWKRGPYLRAGGPPTEIWVVLDSFPEMEGEGALRRNRTLDKKNKWRNWVNYKAALFQQSNPFHTADDFVEGLEMLEAIGEELSTDVLLQQAKNFQKDTDVQVLANLSANSGRSRVWRVRAERNNTVFVQKVFARGFESYLHREIDFYTAFSDMEMVPSLLAWDERRIVLPELVKRGEPDLTLTPTEVRQIVRFIINVNARGFALVNFTPKNLMRDRNGYLRAIDFEFAQRFIPPENSSWYQSPDFRGLPLASDLVRPNGWTFGLDHWDVVWAPNVGVRLSEIRDWSFD